MIKSHTLEDALNERPSNSRLKKLTAGDFVTLSSFQKKFTCKVLFIWQDDLVGVVVNGFEPSPGKPVDYLTNGDLISFSTKKIFEVTPDESRMKLPPFMLVSHKQSEEPYVMHTLYPRMIAIITAGKEVRAKEAVWIDEPVDYDAAAASLLKKMTDWYFYNYVKV
jgi:hypothetical protein